jgi:chromatin remodeling complex protein RSC6
MVKKVKTSTKAKKSTKTKTKAKAKVVAAPVEVTPPVVQKATPPAPPSLGDSFSEVLGHLSALRSQLTAVTAQVRALQKRSERELKNALKATKKRRAKAGNRAPSGFVKPTKISKELAVFLGKPHGTEMARTEVTREINTYIRAHNLQDPKNGRIILADSKLRKLLKLNKSDELTYFNLQRYMSPHFAKSGKSKNVASSSS